MSTQDKFILTFSKNDYTQFCLGTCQGIFTRQQLSPVIHEKISQVILRTVFFEKVETNLVA